MTYTPDVGWALGDGKGHHGPEWDAVEANQLYDVLERQVIPEFYERDREGSPIAWLKRVRASRTRLTPEFCNNRMFANRLIRRNNDPLRMGHTHE